MSDHAQEVLDDYAEVFGKDADPDDIDDLWRGYYPDGLNGYVEDGLIDGLFGEAARVLYDEHPGWVDIDAIVRDLECSGDMTVGSNGNVFSTS